MERVDGRASSIYGPLSIEDTGLVDDDIREIPSWSLSASIANQFLRCRYQRRHYCYCAISLFVLCVIIAALITAKELFHLSIPNLLSTLVRRKRTPPAVTECLPSHLFDADHILVEKLDLTSNALSFNKSLTDVNGIVSSGFLWNDEDAKTTKWRPQGVTTYHADNGRKYALVSWYGRKDEGYSDRGGRISFVDITEMHQNTGSKFSYSHILLVDENFCTLPNIHVGGIEQVNGTLYVADSRKGQQMILEFDIERGLFQLPFDMMDSMFGFQYVLRQSSSFHSPTKPSFMSYDNDNNKFVIGTYARCGKKIGTHVDLDECFTRPNNKLIWFEKDDVGPNSTNLNSTQSCWHYFSEMQGAASAKVGNSTIIWVSSSYGGIADSHLHVVNASHSFTNGCPEMNIVLDEFSIFRFPAGLEDLHIEEINDGRFMWMATEFGTRMVFSTRLEHFLP